MNNTPIRVSQIDVRQVDDDTCVALLAYSNQIRAEAMPDDPPRQLADYIQGLRGIPPFVEVLTWVVREIDRAAILAVADLAIVHMEQNQHLGQVNLSVLSAYRRRGIGSALLRCVVEAAKRQHRSLLIAETSDRVMAGEAFALHVGAHKSLETHTNQLEVVEVNPSLIERWLRNAQALQPHYEMLFWSGAYPEDHIDAAAELLEVMNQAPHGDLNIEEQHFTPELLRQMDQAANASGNQRWRMVVRQTHTGKLVGFTEVSWHPRRPDLLWQDDTGVLPDFRNQGLGRWLKASMLQKVLLERPEVKRVRTRNADVNAPMLKINQEMGYKPYEARSVWQAETDNLL